MASTFEKICVIGLGYIGLPTASLLGTKGYKVHGVDVSEKVVSTINDGRIHIIEPDLDIMVKSAVQAGNLKAGLQPEKADIFIIAVPTPFKDGKQPDLSYVEHASRAIVPYIEAGNLVILESTSPVGTTDEVVASTLQSAGVDIDSIYIAHCPERVLPGRILIELVENDRVVGGINEKSTDVAAKFYEQFVSGNVLRTSAKTAEMVKLTENSSRDVQIAFANELSMICEEEGISPWEVIELANRHPRVNILQPGPGVGGHCIAVDPWFIVDRSPNLSRLIKTAREINDYKPDWVIKRVVKCAEKFKQPKIACLGLSFKANVDDLRESPALNIVRKLRSLNIGDIFACEPLVDRFEEFQLYDLQEALDKADIILLLVDHKDFLHLKTSDFKEKILIDTRGAIKN